MRETTERMEELTTETVKLVIINSRLIRAETEKTSDQHRGLQQNVRNA